MRFRDRRATALSSIMAAQTASSMTVPGASFMYFVQRCHRLNFDR